MTELKTKDHDLKRVGLKVTVPRRKILQILETSHQTHMSAEEVYKLLLASGEEASLATVYRVLTQFEEAGIVNRHHFEAGHAVFELAQNDHHDHLVCVKCGRVQEFVDSVIETRQQYIAKKLGFKITYHAMHLYGECAACILEPVCF